MNLRLCGIIAADGFERLIWFGQDGNQNLSEMEYIHTTVKKKPFFYQVDLFLIMRRLLQGFVI